MKRNLIPVKDSNGLVRDPNSGAILNVNTKEIEKARERKREINRKRAKETERDTKISKMESEITEIKGLLLQLLGKTNGGN